MDTRRKKSVKNISVGLMNQAISIILAFAVKTIFVRLLGAEYTGINGLYLNVVSLLSLAELGVGNVLLFSLYKPLSENNVVYVAAILHYYKKVYRYIAIGISIFGIAIVPLLKYIIRSDLPHDKLLLYYLLFLANSVASYRMVYKSILIQADQKIYISNICNLIFHVLQCTVQILYLLSSKDYMGYLMIQLICTLLKNVTLSTIANRMYPYINNKVNLVKIETKSMQDDIKAMLLYKIATLLINNTDNILISILLGTIFVGYYSNYYMLINQISIVLSLIIIGLTASLGNLNASNDQKKSYDIFRLLLLFFNILTVFCVACFATVLQDFMLIWLGEEFLLDDNIVIAILFTFYISNVVNPVWMYRETLGLFRQMRCIMFIAAVINLLLSIILGKYMGMVGILGASVIARLSTIVWYEPKILYELKFKKPVSIYFKTQLRQGLINIIIIGTCILVCRLLPKTLLFIFMKIIICGFVVIIWELILNGKTEEGQKLKNSIVCFLKRKVG